MFSASQLWPLPPDGAREIAGAPIPPGRIVSSGAFGPSAPVGWISSDIYDATTLSNFIRGLAAVYPTTGLWPLRAEGLYGETVARPWLEGELTGLDTRSFDALQIFAGEHRPPLPSEYSAFADEEPYPPVTSDTLATPIAGEPMAAHDLAVTADGALLLVPVYRPADVPKVIGWAGPANHDLVGEPLSAILRSWEERFDATLISLGFDTMAVQAPRTPSGAEQLRRHAAEHYALCPDIIDQGEDPAAYEESLGWAPYWDFWWD